MATTLFQNIKGLVGVQTPQQPLRGKDLAQLPVLDNAWVRVEDGYIESFGYMSEVDGKIKADERVDGSGRYVIPCWCDSHTHLVFAESRESEFVDKIKGLSYADIAAKGGGILNSAQKLAALSEEELFQRSWNRLQQLTKMGTGSVEIKSGYGLTPESELKMLRVIRKLKEQSNVNIKASFLGAHALPPEYKNNREDYVQLIIEHMIPAVAAEKLADYIDVFCETGFFSVEEMSRIVQAGKDAGLIPKLHINQLNSIGGLQEAIRLNALSVDHLETMTQRDIGDLAGSSTIGTLLPSAAFFLRMGYQPARELIEAGAAIALATDFNPGSSPSGNMPLVIALACIQMRMLLEEAIQAATINGAFAMGLENITGSISIGKRADLQMTTVIPSLAYLPYAFGSQLIDRVMIKGEWVQ